MAVGASVIEHPGRHYAAAFLAGIRPDPRLTVSEWADKHRVLTSESASEPGRWRTSRTPYMREIMDRMSVHDPASRIVLMFGSQLGKTEAIINLIGYVMHHAPAPILMVEPTVQMAKNYSKQRIDPMIRANPDLRGRVADIRSRDKNNTLLTKSFVGGLLMMTGANSAASLSSMPIRYLPLDEVDRYPGDVEGEGDPVWLAEQRTASFARPKVILTSTPTLRGGSRIEAELLRSDRRRYFVPCPECGRMDFLTWSGFGDYADQKDPGHNFLAWDEGQPNTAHIVCAGCEARIDESHKTWMLEHGEWRPTAEGDGETIGYQLNTLYAPFGWTKASWPACVRKFLRAKQDRSLLKPFVNTVLGETWLEPGEQAAPEGLLARAERYDCPEDGVPAGVGVLVGSVDVQGDRLEALVMGYGAGEESWPISWCQFQGDPAREQVWLELDTWLQGAFRHASGRDLRVECVTVDSGGHHAAEVYAFCKTRTRRRVSGWDQRVFAVRGGALTGLPVAGVPTRNNAYRTPLYTLCTDTAKETITARLLIQTPGAGYVHIPEWFDQELVDQLTAERGIWKVSAGKRVRVWKKQRERNEMLDLFVYALAALRILNLRDLPERATRWGVAPAQPQTETPHQQVTVPAALLRKPRGWVHGWKR